MTTDRARAELLLTALALFVAVATIAFTSFAVIPDHAVVPIQRAEERMGKRIAEIERRLAALEYEDTIRPALSVVNPPLPPEYVSRSRR